jgi:hypothetical protein
VKIEAKVERRKIETETEVEPGKRKLRSPFKS